MAKRSGQELLRGSLDLMVLSVLADGAKYGYLIQKRIAEASRDEIKLQTGTLYPLLHRLESSKLIRASWEEAQGRRRCWYELTAKGRTRLGSQASQWRSIARCMDELVAVALRVTKGADHAAGGA